ncbi:hypothetical protein Fmac_011629 [Flemingia macrophylla]|uniref:Uncharacterized protein n=1 Tax=Flemingia macrophylla TaxID=520843 RepID=A0ABD1MMZ0_9FABA
MGYLEKVIINMVLLLVLLLSMNLGTARQPLWMSEPHHKASFSQLKDFIKASLGDPDNAIETPITLLNKKEKSPD